MRKPTDATGRGARDSWCRAAPLRDEPRSDHEGGLTARVVVGIDGSRGSRDALAFALEEARLRGATLHVMHAWQVPLSLSLPDPTIAGYAPVKAEDLDRLAEQLAAGAKQLVAGEIQPVLGDDPGVEVQQDVFEADAAGALVEASRGAELLVVGSRGRGGFTGLLLGSVGQQVAHHAHCPMVIVPHGRDR